MPGTAVQMLPTDVNIAPIHPCCIKTWRAKITFALSNTYVDLIDLAVSPHQKGVRLDNLIVSSDSAYDATIQLFLLSGTDVHPLGGGIITIPASSGNAAGKSEVDVLPYFAANPYFLEGVTSGVLKLQARAIITTSGNIYVRGHGGAYQLV